MNATIPIDIFRYEENVLYKHEDQLAAEEPLEIRIEGQSVAVLMRTPGDDKELAAGFLVSENIVKTSKDIFDITRCTETTDIESKENIMDVILTNPKDLDLKKLTRHLLSSSSCGICSKASIEAIHQQFNPIQDQFKIQREILTQLPDYLAVAQTTFKSTGGLHACALFDCNGKLIVLREDVGRHNALDKLIGYALLKDMLPLNSSILLLSGRVSFEMMQKALAAGIPMIAAISAPTSLSVECARKNGQTLIGFLRGKNMNIYAGAQRLCD